MNVRDATHADILPIVRLAAVMFEESEHYRQFTLDGGRVFAQLQALIDSDDGIVLVAEEGENIVGGFIGGIALMWFSSESKSMYDNGLFILPGHRGGGTAIKLITEAFKQAKDKGAIEAQLTNTTGVASDRVEQLYQHMGMTRVGGQYYKIL